jgi:hypothetical protein
MIIEITNYTGTCQVTFRDGPISGCGGDESFAPENSNLIQNGWHYYRDSYNHDHDEVVATLCPGANQYPSWDNPEYGEAASGNFRIGWNCTGSCDYQIHYIVYQGTTPI